MRITRSASGGMVPGTGSGDHVPALLEPGEAIVPRYLVPLVAPILRSHHVPGFAAGGLVASPSGFSFTGTGSIAAEFAAALKQWAADIAKQTASQITTSINYARGVAGAAAQGQGYGTGGLLGTFTATAGGPSGAGAAPPGAPGYNAAAWNAAVSNAANNTTPAQSVQQQMQSYLQTIQSFGKDLGTLGKQGLNKSLVSQLVAAGPAQGDALAQSILGDPSGARGANKLWQQIKTASQRLGGAAAGALYGGHPSTSGGSFAAGAVTVNVNVGGAGSSGNLTAAQIKQITAQVQAALLKQAKRNRSTGVALPGKNA